MKLRVNGSEQELPDGCTIARLIEHLELAPDGVAVAVDMDVIPRSKHRERVLREGESVEIVRAVGGG